MNQLEYQKRCLPFLKKKCLMYVKMRAPVRIGETKKKPQQIDTFTIKHWLTMSWNLFSSFFGNNLKNNMMICYDVMCYDLMQWGAIQMWWGVIRCHAMQCNVINKSRNHTGTNIVQYSKKATTKRKNIQIKDLFIKNQTRTVVTLLLFWFDFLWRSLY